MSEGSRPGKFQLIYFPVILILLVLGADQGLKFWVKTNMYIGQEFSILGNWFRFHFTENEGMAFGLTIGGDYGKLILSSFRIVALIGLVYYFVYLLRNTTRPGLVIAISLILSGALGNIIDSTFYGLWFNSSYNQLATFLPEGEGYATLMHGRVVDMLYFPVFEGYFPEWFPAWGGEYFIFFRPVFNIADAAITVGVLMIIIFQQRYFAEEDDEDLSAESDADAYDQAAQEAAGA